MKKRILVYGTLAYTLGITAAAAVSLSPVFWFTSLLVLLAAWFFCEGKRLVYSGWLLLLAFFCLGAAFLQVRDNLQLSQLASLPLKQEITVTGEIVAEPVAYPGRTVSIIRLPNKTKIQLVIRGDEGLSLQTGDTVKAGGYLDRPGQARNPGEFDYRGYLWRQGILAQLTCTPEKVEVKHRGTGNWLNSIGKAREQFSGLLKEHLSPTGAAVARALIFGDKTALEQDLKYLFLTLGIMHLLAVSGLHVGFLLVTVRLFRRLIPVPPGYSFLLTAVLLLLYCALTGFTPSVLRASIMAIVLVLGNWLRKERDYYTGLAAAALVLLLINPFFLFQSGFQLSFLAAWGIFYFRPLLEKLVAGGFIFREPILLPLAAQMAVLPVAAYYFNLISLIGFFTNVVVVPVAGMIVVGGLAAFLVSLFSSQGAAVLLVPLGGVLDLLIGLFKPLEVLPFASVSVATPSVVKIMVYYIAAVAVRELVVNDRWRIKFREKRKLLLVWALVGMSLFFAWRHFYPRPLEVIFLDVGQGDAIFLRTPKGTSVLLDGGGTPHWQNSDYRVGKEVVVPFLERKGIRELDLLISSHPDIDHLQGLEDVIAELGAKKILLPPRNLFDGGYDSLLQAAKSKKIPVEEVVAGDRLLLDNGRIVLEILNPPSHKQFYFTAVDNNHSLSVRLRYGKAAILFTGDMEIESLKLLLAKEELAPVSVLKAPHHGSRTGYYKPYLDKLAPVGVVLSVGKNRYGHPAQELVEYWENRQVNIYRTDEQGAITVYTNGNWLKIRPFL